jgi:quercetin dioxygenase-like cupin family protein
MDVKRLGDLAGFDDAKLAKHNLFQSSRFFLDVYCLRPGQAQRPHAHAASDKVYLVLEGRCLFTVGEETSVEGEGAAIFCPAGVDHGVENPGPADARVLVMMAPHPSPPPEA